MPRNDDDGPLALSLLDRLLDDDPTSLQDPRKTRSQAHRELLDAIRRDLETMLNAHPCSVTLDPGLGRLVDSIANYGVATVGSTVYGVERNRESFRDQIEMAIRRFEPRLKRVRVELVPAQDAIDRTIRFRVFAELDAKPAPEPLVFHSLLDPSTLGISIHMPHNV